MHKQVLVVHVRSDNLYCVFTLNVSHKMCICKYAVLNWFGEVVSKYCYQITPQLLYSGLDDAGNRLPYKLVWEYNCIIDHNKHTEGSTFDDTVVFL